jgi:hypothetical protein
MTWLPGSTIIYIEDAWRRVTAAPRSLRVVAIESSPHLAVYPDTPLVSCRSMRISPKMSFLKKKCKFQVDYGLDFKSAIDI